MLTSITFSNDDFIATHGKAPRGYGNWAFRAGGVYGKVFFTFTGTLADAKAAARRVAAAHGITTVFVAA